VGEIKTTKTVACADNRDNPRIARAIPKTTSDFNRSPMSVSSAGQRYSGIFHPRQKR
jgi:hypothetical protein